MRRRRKVLTKLKCKKSKYTKIKIYKNDYNQTEQKKRTWKMKKLKLKMYCCFYVVGCDTNHPPVANGTDRKPNWNRNPVCKTKFRLPISRRSEFGRVFLQFKIKILLYVSAVVSMKIMTNQTCNKKMTNQSCSTSSSILHNKLLCLTLSIKTCQFLVKHIYKEVWIILGKAFWC